MTLLISTSPQVPALSATMTPAPGEAPSGLPGGCRMRFRQTAAAGKLPNFAGGGLVADLVYRMTLSNSTSKVSVAFGGTAEPAPCEP